MFELVANGFSTQKGAAVARLFISELAFRSVSECDDSVIKNVLAGRDDAASRADAGRGLVAFKGVTEGYLLDVAKGEKPGPCKARQPVTLYLAKYGWAADGKDESREAHFMRVGGVWFIAKL